MLSEDELSRNKLLEAVIAGIAALMKEVDEEIAALQKELDENE